jgi:hypothetical protein
LLSVRDVALATTDCRFLASGRKISSPSKREEFDTHNLYKTHHKAYP